MSAEGTPEKETLLQPPALYDARPRSVGLRAAVGRGLGLLPVLTRDALLVVASYAAALALRFDGDVPRESMVFFGQVIAVIILAYLTGNYFFGIYRTAWQYASLADAITLASAVGLVSVLLIGFVDDDPKKRGMRIHGLGVLGGRDDIPELVQMRHVDVVALAMPSAPGAVIRDYVGVCQQANIAVRMVPGVPEIVHPGGSARLREITFDDLLGREEVQIDVARCAAAVRDKEVLITGAAGYLGQELARQLLTLGPAVLHLLDTNETGLYDLQRDLKAEGCEARIWVTNIVDRGQVERTFRAARPDIVFHTAAYKHIPVIEDHPEAAFHVNVVGTMNLCRAAEDVKAEQFIFVSTNKAAELDSVYGATKRIGELLAVALARQSATCFVAVRLHNVMGSRGSVVPLFLRQIERGGPVLLTHAEATRYFMSPPEAVRLLVQAAAFARPSQIFVLDLGEEVKIADLAEKLIRLRGYQPGKDIQIVYTGLRPGEQLSEEPLERRGRFLPTEHAKIFLAGDGPACSAQEIIGRIEALQQDVPERRDELVARLHALARIDLRDVQPAPIASD